MVESDGVSRESQDFAKGASGWIRSRSHKSIQRRGEHNMQANSEPPSTTPPIDKLAQRCLAKSTTSRRSLRSAGGKMHPVRLSDIARTKERAEANVLQCSGASEEEPHRQHDPDQVQSALSPLPLHPRAQGSGQGGEAEAEPSTKYALTPHL